MQELWSHMYVLRFIGGCVHVLTRDISTLIRVALLSTDKEEVVRLGISPFDQTRGGTRHVRLKEV